MKGIVSAAGFVLAWLVIILFSFGLGIIPLGVLLVLTYVGADDREQKAKSLVSMTLMDEEVLIAGAVQKRIFALWKRREVLGITNSRVMIFKRGLFGGYNMLDIQWKDLKDAIIQQNVLDSVCGSNLAFRHLATHLPTLVVFGIESEMARKMYTRAQKEEQSWEEKRRIRAMEEVRAAAGGVTVHAAQPMAPTASATQKNSMMDDIQKAKVLLDQGVISDAEFQEMKSKILAAF
ncbi:SHOCT domain-containing protein [Caulobacter sp. LjRoot300]|uniref:SHOCT domain-containing protein n=1 Tax=Caulobacter sp. LjRoot300 TaxID=3342321 RepID=UPI003ECEFE0B